MSSKQKYILFSILIGLCFFSIFWISPDKQFLFANAKGDCSGRSTFIYNALYNNPTTHKAILLGSSRTMNDINDSLLNALETNSCLNLGYCRYGRNLEYFFAEEYLKTHQPKKIILELRETEGDFPHPVSAFFLPVSKITEGLYSGRTEVFGDLYNKWLCNLKFLRSRLFECELSVDTTLKPTYGYWHRNSQEDIDFLNKKRYQDSVSLENNGVSTGINLNSEFYFRKMQKLCAEKNISLYFLYLPEYGKRLQKIDDKKDYLKFGQLLVPPDSITCNAINYSDLGHLNGRGAYQLALWLNRQLN